MVALVSASLEVTPCRNYFFTLFKTSLHTSTDVKPIAGSDARVHSVQALQLQHQVGLSLLDAFICYAFVMGWNGHPYGAGATGPLSCQLQYLNT